MLYIVIEVLVRPLRSVDPPTAFLLLQKRVTAVLGGCDRILSKKYHSLVKRRFLKVTQVLASRDRTWCHRKAERVTVISRQAQAR